MDKIDEVKCLKCGSTQIHAGKRGYDFFRGGIFGSSQVFITCLKCGHRFKPGDSTPAVASSKESPLD